MKVESISMSLWELCKKHNIIGLVWETKGEAREEEQSLLILTIEFIFPKRKQKGHVFLISLISQSWKIWKIMEALDI